MSLHMNIIRKKYNMSKIVNCTTKLIHYHKL